MAVSDDDKPKPRLLLDERTGILGPLPSPPQSPLLSGKKNIVKLHYYLYSFSFESEDH